MTQQLLREWPPGYGGVERVAHELAVVWGGAIYSFDAKSQRHLEQDPLPVSYERYRLRCAAFGRLLLPMPSRNLLDLLVSAQPLHGHLPSPGVLLILLFARALRPRRRVTAHWHCFLEPSPGLSGWLYTFYQYLAERAVCYFSSVMTTSPVLALELERCGCEPQRIHVVPCCLSSQQEATALALPLRERKDYEAISVLFIGRLDSYKRVDWLIEALAKLPNPWSLDVVGDGPKRGSLEVLTQVLCQQADSVRFHGVLDEGAKLRFLAQADLLVLPSDRSNEAFGIVQLEAMAAGIMALAFERSRSGMGWVCQLSQLQWSQKPEGLVDVLRHLQSQPHLCDALGEEARKRYLRLFQRSVWHQRLAQWTFMP